MESTVYCLLDAGGSFHLRDAAESYSDIARADGLNEDACELYRFDLTSRRLVADRGTPAGDRAARAYIERSVGSPERLLEFAAEGHLSKGVLMNLVTPENRKRYADACAAIEKTYTQQCAAQHDPCLASGCAVEGEICLQPLLRGGVDYRKQCAAEWAKLFADSRNRIDAWRN